MKVMTLIGFLLLLQSAHAQLNFSGIDATLKENQQILGKDFVAMVWKKDDTVVYRKEVGDFNTKTQAPIASCSKWLTAALVMSFVDEGKLSLDDKIAKYIPEFEKYGKNYITIRDCLCHMTGIKSEPLVKMFERKKYASLEDEVDAFAAKDIQAYPATEFRYSEIGLNIAGRILEIISKKKFDVLARQRLFVPLNMRRSTFSTLDGSATNPSGGALSTPDDFLHFLVMILNKGVYQGKRILSEIAVAEMIKVRTKPEQIKYAPKPVEGYNYAFGAWVTQEKDGNATALVSPGLFGTWPLVDFCHGYVYLFFAKSLLSSDRADIQVNIIKSINENFAGNCQ